MAYQQVGSDGLLHAVANAHETQWAVQDPTTDIAADQALFSIIADAARLVGDSSAKDPLLAQFWSAITEIPPYPRMDDATRTQLLNPDYTQGANAGGRRRRHRHDRDLLPPAAQRNNGENIELEPLWPWDHVSDQDANLFAREQRSYANRPNKGGNDWSYDAADAARLEQAAQVESDLVSLNETQPTCSRSVSARAAATWSSTSEAAETTASDVAGRSARTTANPAGGSATENDLYSTLTLDSSISGTSEPQFDASDLPPGTAVVGSVVGPTNFAYGQSENSAAYDGPTTGSDIAGLSALTSTDSNIYFSIDDSVADAGDYSATFTVEYYDSGTGSFQVQYDNGTSNPYQSATPNIPLTNTDTWKTATVTGTGAYFGNEQNGGADFRLRNGSGQLTVHSIAVKISGDGVAEVTDFPPPVAITGPAAGPAAGATVTTTPTVSGTRSPTRP